MIKVITTVGASIFTNYLDWKKDIENHINYIKNKPYKEYSNLFPRIKQIKEKITAWAASNVDASAEIKSLVKIQKVRNEPLDVYLLATETVISALAAEIIRDWFAGDSNFTVRFNPVQDVIKGLQVNDYQVFVQRGLPNLVHRINTIAGGDHDKGGYFGNVIFNIAGGYKGVIPYMTILAQVNNCDIYYIFEESQTIIKIPKTPIRIDYNIFDKYPQEITMLENGIEKYQQQKNEHYAVFDELEKMGLVEIAGDLAVLSPLGVIFFEKYKSWTYHFFCSDEVWNEIQEHKDIKRILSEKFYNSAARENKTEIKQTHMVYDDGDNQNRIYYFKNNDDIYIYKTFQDESAAKKYISTPLNKSEVIKKSKRRQWRLANV
ncbi:MAG: hypothetical protein GX425_08195 [Peptococcaceae bacterium]|nr:hypothetical protein [Peptococcaceae bacterium]